jgi:hypothetical protein
VGRGRSFTSRGEASLIRSRSIDAVGELRCGLDRQASVADLAMAERRVRACSALSRTVLASC